MQSDPRGSQIAAAPGTAGWRARVWPVDVLHWVFFAMLLAVTAGWMSRIDHAGWWIAFDLAALATLALVELAGGVGPSQRGAVLRLIHGVFVVPLVFTQVGVVIAGVRAVDYAPLLERADRVLFFGTNPIEALERWTHPVLTEVMQWAYTSYLLLPPGIVLLLAWKGTGEGISRSLFALLGVMYLSYVGYFLVPAAGPNIHGNVPPPGELSIPVLQLYEFESDLPGVWLAAPLRAWMFAVELTKKDCFPSGHVAVAVVCWVLALRTDRRFAPVFLVLAAGVTVSTVYLRYHYVVDVVAGVLLAWFAVTGWLRLHDRLARGLSGSPT